MRRRLVLNENGNPVYIIDNEGPRINADGTPGRKAINEAKKANAGKTLNESKWLERKSKDKKPIDEAEEPNAYYVGDKKDYRSGDANSGDEKVLRDMMNNGFGEQDYMAAIALFIFGLGHDEDKCIEAVKNMCEYADDPDAAYISCCAVAKSKGNNYFINYVSDLDVRVINDDLTWYGEADPDQGEPVDVQVLGKNH